MYNAQESKDMKTLNLYDVCLPDYFSGHHSPVIQVPVDNTTTVKQVIDGIKEEYSQLWDHYDYMGVQEEDMENAIAQLYIDNADKLTIEAFPDLEDHSDDEFDMIDCVYAYFVLSED